MISMSAAGSTALNRVDLPMLGRARSASSMAAPRIANARKLCAFGWKVMQFSRTEWRGGRSPLRAFLNYAKTAALHPWLIKSIPGRLKVEPRRSPDPATHHLVRRGVIGSRKKTPRKAAFLLGTV